MAEGSDAITGKFDFYDILGYLVPGLVLLGLLWLPFGLMKGNWASTSLTSAVLYLVAAHIAGHILQGFLRIWEIVPEIRDDKGNLRAPSSILLDASPKGLAPTVRAKIRTLTTRFWKIPRTPGSDDGSWDDVADSDRAAAFLQARNLLLQAKKQSYFEQFQGKYALMGGMAAGLAIASAYYAGWAFAFIPCDCIAHLSRYGPYALAVFLVVIVVCFGFMQNSRVLLLLLLVGTFLAGFQVGTPAPPPPQTQHPTETQKGACVVCAVCCEGKSEGTGPDNASRSLYIEHKATFMLILALVAFGAAVRCYGAYKAFAREFAMGVWRDFANFDLLGGPGNQEAQKTKGGPGAVGDA
jgi:hypothetical protein